MKRREFITLIGGAAIAAPFGASGQDAKVPRLGVLLVGGGLDRQRMRVGDYSCYAGAGAFLSTPADLVRFGMAVGGTLLRPDTIRLLQTPQRLASGEATGYGLGWELETLPLGGRPARMAGHGSRADFIGATASFMTFPERGLAVSVMANISLADTRSVALAVAQGFASQPAAAAIP